MKYSERILSLIGRCQADQSHGTLRKYGRFMDDEGFMYQRTSTYRRGCQEYISRKKMSDEEP